ncbi:MAG: hypothetical protein AB7K24_20255 [Gemmataceae bacterium]
MIYFLKRAALAVLVLLLLSPLALAQRGQVIGRICNENGTVMYTINRYPDGTILWVSTAERHMVLKITSLQPVNNTVVLKFIEYSWWGTEPEDASHWNKAYAGQIQLTAPQTGIMYWTHIYNVDIAIPRQFLPVNIRSC